MGKSQKAEFKLLSDKLIEFLNKNGHPHMQVIITTVDAQIVEGVFGYVNKDYIKG